MKNWTIGAKISVGFAAVILIAVTLGMFAFSRVRAIDKNATLIATASLPGFFKLGNHRQTRETRTQKASAGLGQPLPCKAPVGGARTTASLSNLQKAVKPSGAAISLETNHGTLDELDVEFGSYKER